MAPGGSGWLRVAGGSGWLRVAPGGSMFKYVRLKLYNPAATTPLVV